MDLLLLILLYQPKLIKNQEFKRNDELKISCL